MYRFTCKCGVEFETGNYQQRKCSHECGRNRMMEKREIARVEHNVEFIAVDGEGVDTYDVCEGLG
jgi:hypothetical protein